MDEGIYETESEIQQQQLQVWDKTVMMINPADIKCLFTSDTESLVCQIPTYNRVIVLHN